MADGALERRLRGPVLRPARPRADLGPRRSLHHGRLRRRCRRPARPGRLGRLRGRRHLLRRHGGPGTGHQASRAGCAGSPCAAPRRAERAAPRTPSRSWPTWTRPTARPSTSQLMDTRWDDAWRAANPDLAAMIIERFASSAASPGPGLRLQLEARSHHDTSDRLGTISCPTLVAGGRYDGIAPPANSEFLARSIPGARPAPLRRRPRLLPAGPRGPAGHRRFSGRCRRRRRSPTQP